MALDASTIRSLRSVVGDAHVITDPEVVSSYTTDWTGRFVGTGSAVVRPASTTEVADIVRICRSTATALVPQGGNTGLVGGSVPLAGELVLSTTRLASITDVDRDAGQLTAGAGATLDAVQAVAVQAGWRYGIDLAARQSATIGGTVATDAGGLRVVRFGSTRRQLLGVEAVLGTGEVVRRLHGLVKDNTGYDLAGLLCGSEGTLGVVCRVRLALVPAAGETVTALLGFPSLAAAVTAVGQLRRAVPGVEAAEVVFAEGARMVADQTGVAPVLDPVPAVQIVVEAVGPPDPTATMAEAIETLARRVGHRRRHRRRPGRAAVVRPGGAHRVDRSHRHPAEVRRDPAHGSAGGVLRCRAVSGRRGGAGHGHLAVRPRRRRQHARERDRGIAR